MDPSAAPPIDEEMKPSVSKSKTFRPIQRMAMVRVRGLLGMTQYELAVASRLSLSTIQRQEARERKEPACIGNLKGRMADTLWKDFLWTNWPSLRRLSKRHGVVR